MVRRRGVFDPSGGAGGGATDVDVLMLSIKADLQRVTPQLDALQSVIAARKAEAARTGAAAGGRRLPPLAALGAGSGAAAGGSGGGGGGGGGGARGSAAAAESDDPVSTVQGLSHSDSVLAGLKGQLLGVAHSLKGVVAVRSDTVARSAVRRQLFGGAGAMRDLGRGAAAASSGSGAGGFGGSGLGGLGGDAVITMPSAAPTFAAVTQAQLSRDPELQFLSARAADVSGLEATIAELGGLFGRLASVVAEQGAGLERIDQDLEAAAGDLDRGHAQLQRAWASAASGRNLALRVVGVLVVFAIFYSVVLV